MSTIMEVEKDSLQFMFGSTIRALHKRMAAALDRNGISLSPEQFHLLKITASKEDSIQSELAEIVQMDKSGVMRHIDQMETKGLVQRINDATDRRKKYIAVTQAGEAELQRCFGVMKEVSGAVLKDISDAELLVFKQVLAKLKDNAER